MKIDITSPSYIFSDLKAGDVFTIKKYDNLTYTYMKVHSSGPVSFPYNAVNLEDGELAIFTDGTIIDYINVTLVKTKRDTNG